jgi:hypothetical protein
MNLFLGKDKNNNNKALDESSSKKNLLSPYLIEKIKKLNTKENNIPELALEKMSNSIMNSSLKQDYSSPRKKNKEKRQINNMINDEKKSNDFLSPNIKSKNEFLEKNNENQIEHFKNNINLLAAANNSNTAYSSKQNSFIQKANKTRVSGVISNDAQNSKKQIENYDYIKRKETKTSFHINNNVNENKDYNPSNLRNMRNDCVYCVSGKALRFICENQFNLEFKKYEFPFLLSHIKKFGKIFYEMKSEDKSLLIDYFRKIPNKITCMVGNGQNDIDAIMTSHVGININPPINYNTVLCHFSPTNGSLFCIEKIIRYGRVIYENIYLLAIESLLSSFIIINYQIGLSYFKIVDTNIDFLSCNTFLLSIFAFIVKPDLTIKSSPLFNNPSLYKIFFILITISIVIITLGYSFLFIHYFSRNKELEIGIQDNIFKTYSHIFVFFQIVSTLFSINSINFYRITYQNNLVFWSLTILILMLVTFVYCVCGYSFHPLIDKFLYFEYSSKNGDTFDDKNKLVCFLIYISNGLTYYFFVCILLAIFKKKAQIEQDKIEKEK